MKINETQKITVQFIVTSFNSPIVLQGLKKTFNLVSRFIQIFIMIPKIFHIEFCRDTNGCIFCCQRFNNFISRISSVRQYIFKVDTQNLFLEKQSLTLPADKLILIGLPFLSVVKWGSFATKSLHSPHHWVHVTKVLSTLISLGYFISEKIFSKLRPT